MYSIQSSPLLGWQASIIAVAIMAGAITAGSADAQTISINAQDEYVTRVNIFTPYRGKQADTVRLLQEGLSEEMSAQPGFISAAIHQSLDSENVVVYAQWRDQAAFEAAGRVRESGGTPLMSRVFEVARPASHPYRVISIIIGQDARSQ